MSKLSDNRFLFLVFALLLTAGLLFATGCDDDPGTPASDDYVDDVFMAMTPDSLVAAYLQALGSSDGTIYEVLFADDFRYLLSAVTVTDHNLPVTWLNRAETVKSGLAMFAGDPVDNILSETAPGVEQIHFLLSEPIVDWAEADELSVYPGSLVASFHVRLDVYCGEGYPLVSVSQTMMFYVTAISTTLSDGTETEFYRMARVQEIDLVKSEEFQWGYVLCRYLAPENPTAILQLSDGGGFPLASVACDATGSSSSLHGLHEKPYRFFAEDPESWSSDYLGSATHVQDLESPGAKTIQVEVRDRWGQTATAEADVTVEIGDAPDASTLTQLMKNFGDSYTEMVIDSFTDLLHPNFKMILLSSTLDDWGFPADYYFDSSTMAAAHTGMFRGDAGVTADGNVVHPIEDIHMDLLEQQGEWAAISVEDPNFGGFGGSFASYQLHIQFWSLDYQHKFEVQQEVLFYAAPVDVGGETIYKLLGIRGLPPFRKSDETSWDSLIALYR